MLIDAIVLQAVTIQGKHSQQETNGYNIKNKIKKIEGREIILPFSYFLIKIERYFN